LLEFLNFVSQVASPARKSSIGVLLPPLCNSLSEEELENQSPELAANGQQSAGPRYQHLATSDASDQVRYLIEAWPLLPPHVRESNLLVSRVEGRLFPWRRPEARGSAGTKGTESQDRVSTLAVYDCMLFFRAAARPRLARPLFDFVHGGQVTLCLSPDVLAEIRDVLTRPKLIAKYR
jgi:hypothetical protein